MRIGPAQPTRSGLHCGTHVGLNGRMTVPPPHGTFAPSATVGEVGEFAVIDRIVAQFSARGGVSVGPGDDAAEIVAPAQRVLLCTDVLVEGRHFRRDWVEAGDVGRRAAAQSLADIAAMGGRATALTLGIVAPADLPAVWLADLAAGISAECELVEAAVVGGDLTRGDSVVLAVSAVGSADGPPVLRSGARPGDVVAVCGRLGWAAAGLAVLGRGFRSPRAVVEAYRRPEVPYAAGPQARELGATAMIDVSDGLLADLGHVAAASGVVIDVRSSAFAVAEPLQAVGAALGADPLAFVLTGGDDHALAATFPADLVLPPEWVVVGTVGPVAPGADGPAVTVDGAAYDGPTGFRHF